MSEFVSTVAHRTLDDLPGPRAWPLVGSALELGATDVHEVFEDWSRRFGEVFGFRVGRQRAIGVRSPELVRELLQARPDSFRRFSALEGVARDLGFYGVFAAEGADWRRQRRLMNPSFHAPHIESFHGPIASIVERLFDVWDREAERGASVDALADLMKFTVDVTSIVAFGRDLDTVRNGSGKVQRHLERIFPAIGRRVVAPFPYWKVFPFLERKVDRAIEGVRALMLELVADARARLAENPGAAERPATLLESMIVATDDEEAKEPFTDDEVYGNVVTMLLAGEDTTAITIAWMLYYLALHPEVAERARHEVDAVVSGTVPTIAEAKQLRYLDAIALEALRMRPPGPQLMLEARQDVVIAGVSVPKGTGVLVMLRMIQMNPEVFGDPERFRPERFLPDAPAETKPHTPRLMLAFGAGPRVCPGRGLALLECALLVGAVVKRYEVELVGRAEDVREVTTFTTQPRGLRVRFRRR